MIKISITSHKGGVGKTSTAINLAHYLSKEGRVLVVDCDAQANSTCAFGINTKDKGTLAELLCIPAVSAEDVIQKTKIENLDIIPSDTSLMIAEAELATKKTKELILRSKLKNIDYDYVIFDCPPSFHSIVLNALAASDHVILPISLGYFALDGIHTLLETLNLVNHRIASLINHKVSLLGILVTFHDTRTKLGKSILSIVKDKFFDQLFKTTIPQNIKIAESQAYEKTIFDYDPSCAGAQAYTDFSKEVLERVKSC